jgi:hypothetical protein
MHFRASRRVLLLFSALLATAPAWAQTDPGEDEADKTLEEIEESSGDEPQDPPPDEADDPPAKEEPPYEEDEPADDGEEAAEEEEETPEKPETLDDETPEKPAKEPPAEKVPLVAPEPRRSSPSARSKRRCRCSMRRRSRSPPNKIC